MDGDAVEEEIEDDAEEGAETQGTQTPQVAAQTQQQQQRAQTITSTSTTTTTQQPGLLRRLSSATQERVSRSRYVLMTLV
jgi:hypothetical protein